MSEEATRCRVLEAAGPLFAEKGFDGVKVREITKLAGTNLAAVNYHFRSKEHLYVETVRHAGQICAATVPLPDWPPEVPPRQRLRDFVDTLLARLLRPDVPAWHRTLIMRELAQPRHGACEELVREFIRPSFEKLMGVLRDLVPPGTPPERLQLIGGSIVGQCLHYHHCRHVIPLLVGPREAQALDAERLADHITAFSLAAIKGLFPSSPHPDRSPAQAAGVALSHQGERGGSRDKGDRR
jgi:AcrR family transcriptional regulator